MKLDEVADTLYALPRAEFTAARDARVAEAKAAGERELARAVGALRRPTAAAALVNELARHRPEQWTALAELGEALRAAHRELDGAALRRLTERRRELLDELVRVARAVGEEAGTPVSDAVVRELETMITAALADADAARALASGRLSSARELDDAAALDWPASPLTERTTGQRAGGARAVERSREAAHTVRPPHSGASTGVAHTTRAPADGGATATRAPADGGATATRAPVDGGATATRAPADGDDRAAGVPSGATGVSAAVERARGEVRRLGAAEAEARAVAEAAARAHHDAVGAEDATHRAVAELRAELIAAEETERRARAQARAARREREDADRRRREAERRHDVARARLAALTPDTGAAPGPDGDADPDHSPRNTR